MAQRWSGTDPVDVTNLNAKCADGGVYQADASAPDNSVYVDANGNVQLKADQFETKLSKLKKAAGNNNLDIDADADATYEARVMFFRNAGNTAAKYRVIFHKGTGAWAVGAEIDAANGRLGLNVENPTDPINHSSGAKLTAAGVWTDASSVALKENFEDVDFSAIIAAIK
ncbi:hypothetical protein D6833_00405, partial [Candidatus Parcubacteria bacterium]